jgi:GAF domain-containing protein
MTAKDRTHGPADDVHELSEALSRVARHLQEVHGDVDSTLASITAAAVATIPHADECGVTYVVGRRKVEPRAATSDLPRQVDALQNRVGQGPCLDAVWDEEVVRVDDLGTDDRWPDFATKAAELGVGSMICFRLFVEGDALGALNVYARQPHAFDDESLDVGHMFATHAAVALAGAEHEADLRRGMDTRDVIGQAKGILMERHKLTADQAFGVLARVSQEKNRKLVDIAREVTATGAVPTPRRTSA